MSLYGDDGDASLDLALNLAADRIGAEEQVAEGTTQRVGNPPPRQMLRVIVDQVAALAEALEIVQRLLVGS